VNSEARDEASTTRNETGKTEVCTAAIALQAVTDDEALITPLHHLATDCLRLSMCFFHPIQQCAQQIYHTALPVSRTFSQPDKPCLWSVAGNQPSHVTAFTGAPDTWGSLLRTIDARPRELQCIATSAQRIIAAGEDIVDIYDAVTFVLQQSLRVSEPVRMILTSPDGSTLFFAHLYFVTVWDVQTGGLTHTFTPTFTILSGIANTAVSTTGDHIACISYEGSVVFWNNHTKEEGRGFDIENGERVVAIHWMLPLELAVVTETTVCIRNIATGETLNKFSVPGHAWGVVYLGDPGEFLVGISRSGLGADQEWCFLKISKSGLGGALVPQEPNPSDTQPLRYPGVLSKPRLAGEEIVCITDNRGVQSFNHRSMKWAGNPPLLDAAKSVTVSLNKNLVVQTFDSIQIFSLDVLTSSEARTSVWASEVHPLGEKHVICLLEPDNHLAILDLGTLRELLPDDNTPQFQSLLKNQLFSTRGLVAEFGLLAVTQAWQSRTPLLGWGDVFFRDVLGGSSPDCTRIVKLHDPYLGELRVRDAKDGTVLASRFLKKDNLDARHVYNVTFDSETRFHLKIDKPGQHVRVPYDIIASPRGPYSHTITKGEPVPLSEPRERPPYTLDANYEWVIDAESRKICWISPGNVCKYDGGHFWAGLSLVMVGKDGVVRKLSFNGPDR
jgi:hypothetical protein